MASRLDLDLTTTQQEKILQLNGLDAFRMQPILHTEVIQLQRNIWHDKHIKEKTFQEGDWAMLYDSRFKDFKGNLMTRCLNPYIVDKCDENGFV